MTILDSDNFKEAIRTIVALGATAPVLVKVAKLINDPDTDLTDICALLKNDGPLAGDIIRISNSSYYAPATPHGNLNSAVNYIGLKEVIRVVNLSLSRQLFAHELASYGISGYDYWSDSVATALVMEALAKNSHLNPEDAYTIGMMHAIGRLVIDRVIADQGYSIYWDGDQPIQDWEREAVGLDFAETGAILVENWRFPSSTCDAIRWQLDPEKVVEPVSLLGALQFTRRLLALTGSNFKNWGWRLPETDPYMQAAGVTPTLVDHIISDCEDNFKRIRQSVDL